MLPEYYIGLDVHRKTIVTAVKDPMGKVLDRTTMAAKGSDLIAYLNRWSGTKHVALEACHVWEHVYDAATKAADRVVLSNPFKTRLISEASLKNDKVDADALAELLRLNGLPESYAPNQEIRDLRQLVRDRQFYKDLEKNVKNHIYSILLRKGIEYQDQHLKSKARREALRKLSLPQIDRGLDALEDLRDRVKDLDKAITKEFETNKDAQLLASIPGIGELTSLTLVAELCPIHRFANIEKVASYCGFVPTNWQSGEVEYHGRMKRKDANSLLKKILVEAAWAHRRLAPASSDVAKIGKRVARKHGAGKGSGAAAHKLLKIVYAVLKRGTPYTPERPGRVLDPAESSGGRVKVGAGSRSGPDGRVSS